MTLAEAEAARHAEAVRDVELKVMSALAGAIAVKLARLRPPGRPGWPLHLGGLERTAWHESGHAILDVARGFTCHALSIVPLTGTPIPCCKGENKYPQGWALSSAAPAIPALDLSKLRPGPTDVRTAADMCLVLYGVSDWRSILARLRPLQAEAEYILFANINCLQVLARRLLREKTLEQAAIMAVCDEHMRLIVKPAAAKQSAAVACEAMTPRC